MKSHSLIATSAFVLCALLGSNRAYAQDAAPAPDTDAQYQAQQQQYQEQLRENQGARQDYQNQQQDYQNRRAQYEDQTAAYEALRTRYASERAAYRRYEWPARFAEWRLKSDSSLMNVQVHLINGNTVGNVIGAAHGPDRVIEALQVMLDDRSIVWFDARDVRFDQFNGTIITDLYPSDIRQMAREQIG
jgi:C-terminal processing protease CtpA/Prc